VLNLVVDCTDLAPILSIHILLMRLVVNHGELNDCVQVGAQEKTPVVVNVVACQVATYNVARII
jgi:hypothetical protein